MENFTYSYPTMVHFGAGCAPAALRSEARRMGDVVMLCYGGGSVMRNGIYDEVKGELIAAGKTVVDFGGIMPNPTYAKVQEGAALARERGADFILAVGGGSVIDCCKVISVQAKTAEDIWNLEFVERRMPEAGIPLGAVVTASGTGAEMNAGAVITHEEKLWKGGVFGTAPAFAILDSEYTATVPFAQVISGAFDTLSHAMETYLGASDEDNVSDDLALAIMRNTVTNMRRILKDHDDMQARGNLMWDSAMAENGILKCGRRTDFQAHQIEHQLGAYTDCNHGQGLAVVQPAYYRHIAEDAREKFAKMAEVAFGEHGTGDFPDALESFVAECGLPMNLGELKSNVPITRELLRKVADSTNVIESGPRKLTRDEIYDILCECL